MKFLVTDRESIEDGFLVEAPYLVISIRDPEKAQAKVAGRPRDILYLCFDDAEPVRGLRLPKSIQLMTQQHADVIWRFFEKYKKEVEVVLCHCEQGMSRSPAVAAALCQATGGDPSRFFQKYQPNQHVFQLLIDAAPESYDR